MSNVIPLPTMNKSVTLGERVMDLFDSEKESKIKIFIGNLLMNQGGVAKDVDLQEILIYKIDFIDGSIIYEIEGGGGSTYSTINRRYLCEHQDTIKDFFEDGEKKHRFEKSCNLYSDAHIPRVLHKKAPSDGKKDYKPKDQVEETGIRALKVIEGGAGKDNDSKK